MEQVHHTHCCALPLQVGCGVNLSCSMPTYVCQYAAAGNVLNADWSQQVQPAIA
jgi:hypothetical protein